MLVNLLADLCDAVSDYECIYLDAAVHAELLSDPPDRSQAVQFLMRFVQAELPSEVSDPSQAGSGSCRNCVTWCLTRYVVFGAALQAELLSDASDG